MISYRRCILTTGLLLGTAMLSAQAGTFFNDFNSGDLPAGTHTNANENGGAYLELTGGVGDSGCLKLTKNINSQQGSFILDDLDAGAPIYGFEASFKLRIGGGSGTPADGFSFVVAPDLQDTINFGEGGTGSGLRVCWDIYSNPDTPPAPRIYVAGGAGGAVLAWKGYTIATISTGGTDPNTWWADVHIRLEADGSLDLDYKGANILTNWFIPGYQDLVNLGMPMRFGFGARTGGLNANQWIDNLQITTFTQPRVGISQQPFAQTVQQGDEAQFDVRVANVNEVTYQWYKDSVAIPGATDQTLKIPNVQPSMSGSLYKVTATGPNNAVTSDEVTLTVINLPLPSTPQLSFNFDDGAIPAGTTILGTTFVAGSGGVGNSGCLQLTQLAPDQNGAFIVEDPNAGAAVHGFTARFQTGIGGDGARPADGFGFGFGNDIPADPTIEGARQYEEGQALGTGLRISVDVYDNDNIFGYASAEPTPAFSIDVRYGNQIVASKKLPLSFLEPGVDPTDFSQLFADTIIQLNTDGTLNVVYHGALVFDRLPIPGFSSVSGGRFAWAARTGGAYDNFWFDNVEITTVTTPGEIRIVSQSGDQTIVLNHAMTNTIVVNDTAGVTFQWYRGSTAISGATDSAYVLSPVALTDSGAKFTATATKASVTVTSAPVTLTVCDLAPPTAPQFSFNFDDGQTPAGTWIYGNSYLAPDGGVGNSGCLHLTDALEGQNGALVVTNLVFGGNLVSGIAVSFDVRLGGGSGSPADGFSFNWAPGLTEGTVANSETGTGNGVSLCLRRYIGNGNADNPPSPYIGIKYKGAFVATTQIPGAQLDTDLPDGTPAYATMLFRVDPDGKAYLAYGDRVLWNGLQLPNYTFIANSKFGIYGRTGGQNINQWFDNIKIQATEGSAPMAIVTEPADALLMAGQTATFSVEVNNPVNATYQWQKNGANIAGATQSAYTTPAASAADSGTTFRATITGPSGSVTSRDAVLTVVEPITVNNPIVTYDFNDCGQPLDTIINGAGASSGYIACFGGVGDSGVLHLTDATGSLQSSFLMPDFNTNAPVKGFTASMALRIADGSGTPADGISFCWGSSNSIPDTANFGETGQGDGVSVGLITYAGRSDGPSFNVWYKGNQVANKIVPYSALSTEDLSTDPVQQYATLAVRVNENGTLDLQYKGNAIFNALPLPDFAPMAGARFAMGARTGGEYESHWADNIQIATVPGLVSASIDFSLTSGGLRMTWDSAVWKLQSTPTLMPSDWQDVPGATPPYTAVISSGSAFYRLAPIQ